LQLEPECLPGIEVTESFSGRRQDEVVPAVLPPFVGVIESKPANWVPTLNVSRHFKSAEWHWVDAAEPLFPPWPVKP
jgi:hypothetical protein